MQPTTNHVRDLIETCYEIMGVRELMTARSLPVAQPTTAPAALPGELPYAYLTRVGDSPEAVAMSRDIENALTDAECEARHLAALTKWRGYRCEEWIGCNKLTPNTGDFDVTVFYTYDAESTTAEIEAVYDPFTWEDLTALVSNENRRRMESRLEEKQDRPDPVAEREDAIGDYRLHQMRDEQD